ncbi:MAG TPA: ATP-binding cassette domain-containing protein [bacterium]|nr:ATP-binding cassette domain-containing protein [bacterium]
MPPVLQAKNILKTYSGRVALAADDLSFNEAEVVAVCGPNGSGKSTLLRILALLDYPDRGDLSFRGKTLSSRGDWFHARKSITMVAQDPYAFSGTVFHNVAYGLKLRNAAGIEQRVREALELVGLHGLERRRARTLSGGEVQRMAIARAMVCDPAVLVLDEPTANVDAARVREVELAAQRLRDDKGVTVIMATHGSDQACRMSDRLFTIEHGNITEQGGSIAPGSLSRGPGGLSLCVTAAASGRAAISSLELSGEFLIIRLDSSPSLLRVPKSDADHARPLPGESVTITAAGPDKQQH